MQRFVFIFVVIYWGCINTILAGPVLSSVSNSTSIPTLNPVASPVSKPLSSHAINVKKSSYKNEKINALIAAYIYYFTKFVRWPEDLEKKTICVVGGADSLLSEFKKIAKKQSSHIHLNSLSYIDFAQAAPEYAIVEHCHLLYITENYQGGFLREPPERFRGLLVVDEFMKNEHAVIRLVMNGKKLSFEISRGNAKKQQLYVSAKLLGLAKAVVD